MKKHSFFLIICFIVLISCASGPRVTLPVPEDEFVLLPAGGTVYLWADMVNGRPLLDALSPLDLSSRDITRIMDKMETAIAALYGETEERRFYLAAKGNFPRFRADLSFSFGRGWRRLNSGNGTYWYSRTENTAVALNSNLVRVSNTDPLGVFDSEYPPQGYIEFRSNMALAGWMPEPSVILNNFMSAMGIPLQIPAEDFFFGAAQAHESDWELVFRIRTASEAQARALVVLFSTARLFILRNQETADGLSDDTTINPLELAALLFANIPDRDADALILRTNPISSGNIALLFRMFQIYSN